MLFERLSEAAMQATVRPAASATATRAFRGRKAADLGRQVRVYATSRYRIEDQWQPYRHLQNR